MSSKPSKIDPKDFSKKTKWELQAEQDEKVQAKVDSVAKKLFDPAKLTELVNTIHEENDPYLGVIRYGELSLHDAFIIEKCKSDAEKTSMAAYLMLKKGNPSMPTYTPENISEWQKTLPMAEGALLLLFIRKAPAFLRAQSLPGLIQTQTPKTSP
jgi:hypothetical protein